MSRPVTNAAEKYDHAYAAYARLSRDHIALCQRHAALRDAIAHVLRHHSYATGAGYDVLNAALVADATPAPTTPGDQP